MHTEQEAAQTLLGARGSTGPDEKKGSAAFLGKPALGLRLVPPGEFNLPESSSLKVVLCHFSDGP